MRKVRLYEVFAETPENEYDLICIKDENNDIITYAYKRTMDDYIEECLHGNNECAYLQEKFVRVKNGKDAILWYDSEVGELYISY